MNNLAFTVKCINSLGDLAVRCSDKAPCVVNVTPDNVVGEVRLKHKVFGVNLNLEFRKVGRDVLLLHSISLILIRDYKKKKKISDQESGDK